MAAIINGKSVRFVAEVPELMEQWDWERNPGVDPANIAVRSFKKVWFRCPKCGHSTFATPYIKTQHGTVQRCPACRGYVVCNFDKSNSFGKVHPELVQYWDSEKNTDTPFDVVATTTKRRWFKCKNCGRSHLKQVNTFAMYDGCEGCARQLRTSFGEDAVAYYLSKCGFNVVRNDRNLLDGIEIDIFLPDLGIAIEYDGMYYHSKRLDSMEEKYESCKKHGYQLYRIAECSKRIPFIDISEFCDWGVSHMEGRNRAGLMGSICSLLNRLGTTFDVDVDRDADMIENGRHERLVANSVATDEYAISLWDYDRNEMRPETVSINSSTRYWFKCPRCGRPWHVLPRSLKSLHGCWKCRPFGVVKKCKIVEKELDGVTVVRIWDSAYEAAKALGLRRSGNIMMAAKGRYGVKRTHVAYGRYWDLPCADDAK